jgi:hypothetical protein
MLSTLPIVSGLDILTTIEEGPKVAVVVVVVVVVAVVVAGDLNLS